MNLYAERLKHTMNLDRRARYVRRFFYDLRSDVGEFAFALFGIVLIGMILALFVWGVIRFDRLFK